MPTLNRIGKDAVLRHDQQVPFPLLAICSTTAFSKIGRAWYGRISPLLGRRFAAEVRAASARIERNPLAYPLDPAIAFTVVTVPTGAFDKWG